MSGHAPLTRVSSRAMPLDIDSIDTDVITPMPRVMDGTYVEHAFEPLRFEDDGRPKPDDPFADARFTGAEILVTGANFGCGSSRETAVWAIKGMGYRVVIAESFGDIFSSNCFKNGVLALRLPRDDVRRLLAQAQSGEVVTIDLDDMLVTTSGGLSIPFQLPELRRTALREGLDDLDVTLRMADLIEDFAAEHLAQRPWVLPKADERHYQA